MIRLNFAVLKENFLVRRCQRSVNVISTLLLLLLLLLLLVGMLLVSRFRLVEDDAVEVFHYYGFHVSSSFSIYNFKSFQEK